MQKTKCKYCQEETSQGTGFYLRRKIPQINEGSNTLPVPDHSSQAGESRIAAKHVFLTLAIVTLVGILVIIAIYFLNLNNGNEGVKEIVHNDPKYDVLASSSGESEVDLTEIDPSNNFSSFILLDKSEEKALGIVTPPSSIQKVSSYNRIEIFDTPDSDLSSDDLDILERLLEKMPPLYKRTPPKGLIAVSSLDDLTPSFGRNKYALASGPYIYIDRTILEKFSPSKENSMYVKSQALFDEFTHVIQYYYSPDGNMGDLEFESTMVVEFAKATNWQASGSLGDNVLSNVEGKDIENLGTINSWNFAESIETASLSTEAKVNPLEDEAIAFGTFISGQPQLLTESRRNFIKLFLNESSDPYEKGVFPIHPEGVSSDYNVRGYLEKELKKMEESEWELIEQDDLQIEGKSKFNDILNYYKSELEDRDFISASGLKEQALVNKVRVAVGKYSYDETTYIVGVLDFKNTTEAKSVPDKPVVSVWVYE